MAYEIGDYDRATPWLEEATVLYQQLGDEANEAWSAMYQGMVALKRGFYAEATAYHQRALELARKRADGFQEGIHLTNLARVTLRLGDYPQALEQFHASLALKQQNADVTGQAFAWFYLGLTQLFCGQYEAAGDAFETSLALWQQVAKNERGVSYCHYGLGLLTLHQERYTEAVAYFRRAHATSVKLVLKAEIIENLSFLGRAELGLGQCEAALAASQEALDLLRTQRDVEAVQNIYLNHFYILSACGAPDAAMALTKAYEILMEQAQHLENESARLRFLERVPVNQEILLAMQRPK
jgi:tetratricopeptide (TPR) repeat protein